jgi:hypothetical protein
MRPLLIAALLLSAASGANAQKKLDLSGLTGGPTPGPSMDAGPAGPEKDIVLAAIGEYTGARSAVALKHFAPMFGSRNKPDGSSEAFGEANLKEAGKLLEEMIKSGKVAIKPIQGGGAAGAWAPDISDGKMTGGTFEVGDSRAIKEIGRGSRNYSQLFKQDQFANTILHETGHMFYSVITLVQGFAPQNQPSVPQEFSSRSFWNGIAPPLLCKDGDKCPYVHSKGPCRDMQCYYWKITNHGYGVGNATEFAARAISQEMCDEDRCSSYARVLDPVFR